MVRPLPPVIKFESSHDGSANEEVASSLQKAGTTLETVAETFEKLADTSASAIGAQRQC